MGWGGVGGGAVVRVGWGHGLGVEGAGQGGMELGWNGVRGVWWGFNKVGRDGVGWGSRDDGRECR